MIKIKLNNINYWRNDLWSCIYQLIDKYKKKLLFFPDEMKQLEMANCTKMTRVHFIEM